MPFPNRAAASRTPPSSGGTSVCGAESDCLVKGSRRMAVLNKTVQTRVKALYVRTIVCVTLVVVPSAGICEVPGLNS